MPIQQEGPLVYIARRLDALWAIETAVAAVDDQDWEYLLSKLAHGGRDKFWKTVIGELRQALASPQRREGEG